jgi:hypothetical protein
VPKPAIWQVSPGGKYRQGNAGETIFPVAMDEQFVASFLPFWGQEGVQFELVATYSGSKGRPPEASQPPSKKSAAQELHASGILGQPAFWLWLTASGKRGGSQISSVTDAHNRVRESLGLSSLGEMTHDQLVKIQADFCAWKNRGGA